MIKIKKLQMLFQIIFRIHSPSLGREPNYKDLRHKENVIGMTAMRGLKEGINETASGKVDESSGISDFDVLLNAVQEFAEVAAGIKKPDAERKEPESEYYTTSGFKATPLICKNCGGQIDRKSGKCPFCDTQYDFEEESESYAYLYADDGLVEKIKLGGDTK